ncbi:hypothetical protein BASA50_007235 [Batrachochytrium salamandrivorans]|uniref:Uncharacterized protein n=1 Tax=Batrachochytrium salamandrivorans TaxID=1357716 RepID=A0ABQ8FAR8_9FUNG|nr:hypothetical protein BASA50_007235 [Batrachochytrium salamandrivorans]
MLTADLDWNDAALRSQFRIGLSSEIKDAWVHFDPPTTLSHAMDLAIKLDNRLFERRQEQRQQQKPVSQYNSKSNVGPHSRYQQNYQQIEFLKTVVIKCTLGNLDQQLTTHYQNQMILWILTLLIEDH